MQYFIEQKYYKNCKITLTLQKLYNISLYKHIARTVQYLILQKYCKNYTSHFTYCWNRPTIYCRKKYFKNYAISHFTHILLESSNNLLQKNIARIMHYLILHTYCWNREQFIAEKKIAKKLYNMSLVHTA